MKKYDWDNLEHCEVCNRGALTRTDEDKCDMTEHQKKNCRSPWGVPVVFISRDYMSSDNEDYLHKFAEGIGLDRIFFSDTVFPKYRLPDPFRDRAKINGAQELADDKFIARFTPQKIPKPGRSIA